MTPSEDYRFNVAPDRLPVVANDHEHVGIPREPQPAENADLYPPHDPRRDA